MFPGLKRILLGSPLQTGEFHHRKLSKKEALTVFASDNLSSTAYATEEILIVLVLAGPALFYAVVPIGGAIAILLAIVVLSYAQLIRVYPTGGGTYEVAKENLGVGAGLVAAAALLIDYILTVAVSITAGVAAFTSAFPRFFDYRPALAAFFIGVLVLANLRGVRESARTFAIPVYTFIVCAYALILLGIVRHLHAGPAVSEPPQPSVEPTLLEYSVAFLLLRAFAHGCVALTGVEAVADGVQALKEPIIRNAQITLYVMGAILGSMFLGLSYNAYLYGVAPQERETVFSQIARTVFGTDLAATGALYYLTQISTMTILIIAANTSFAGFPRLASILAKDHFVPRQLSNLGDRLVFSNGILVLGLAALALILAFKGNVHALIPLYAIGVFLSFTLAQSGLVVRWWKGQEEDRWRVALNALGALVTGAVLLIIAYVKFTEGAWLIFVAVPAIMLLFWKTRRHYFLVTRQLSLADFEKPRLARHTVVIPVAPTPNKVVLTAVEYAKSISQDVIAVTVNVDGRNPDEILEGWKKFVDDVPLIVLDSPYRSVTQPLLRFIDEVEDLRQDDKVTVLLPEFVPARWWHNLLHNQTSLILKGALLFRPGVVVISVPHHLRE